MASSKHNSSASTHRHHAHDLLTNTTRRLLVIAIGEFCGTFLFLLLSYIGAQSALSLNSTSSLSAALSTASLLIIACAFGSALAINVWIFYRVTGGMFNPAVTLGLLLVGAVDWQSSLIILPTQIVAGIAAAAVTDGLLPGPLTVGNSLSAGVNVAQGLFLEMFLTSQLVLTVYFLAVEKHRATFLAPVGIGLSVFVAHICGTNYTGTSINPARSFGAAVIIGFPSYHWIFWLGPCMGALMAFGCYKCLKFLEYETVNPGQDAPIDSEALEGAAAQSTADIRSSTAALSPPGSSGDRHSMATTAA